MSTELERLLGELHGEAAWENETGARHRAEAIARIGGDAAVDALAGVLVKMAAIDLTDDGGDVSDECWRASTAAAHGLGLLGELAMPRLLELVTGPPSRARGYAARALATTRDPRALPPLLALADDEGDRNAALAALGRLGLPDALPLLRAAMRADTTHERATAATALGALRHAESCALLGAMLADPEWYVRYHVCGALGELGTAEARAALQPACSDIDRRVAERARAALAG